MKVLIATSTGATQNSIAICHAMGRDPRVDLTVVLPSKLAVDKAENPSGWLVVEREQRSNGFQMISVSLRDPYQPKRGFRWGRLVRIIRKTRPEIIHVWEEPLSYRFFQFAWLSILARSKAKVIFYGFQNVSLGWKWLHRMLWKLTWKRVSGGAMANNEGVENLRRLGFPKDRLLERIFYGIPTDLFCPIEKQKLKRELEIDCRFIVGYLGRLVPEKGLDWLLDAVELLPSNIHCLVVGDGSIGTRLEQRSSLPGLQGRVHFSGFRIPSEVPKFLNCFDVLAVPSLTTVDWKEQYGRVIAEAMACGVPVVGSDSGAIPEVVGDAGLIVREGDVSALAEALRRAIFTEIRPRLIAKGLHRAQTELSAEAMSNKLLSFYERVLTA